MSIIEALSYSTPVISTDYKSIPEQVIDGFNGYLVEFGKPEQIAEAVMKLHSNPEIYEAMRKNSRKHFEEHFTRKAHLKRLLPIISGCARQQ